MSGERDTTDRNGARTWLTLAGFALVATFLASGGCRCSIRIHSKPTMDNQQPQTEAKQ